MTQRLASPFVMSLLMMSLPCGCPTLAGDAGPGPLADAGSGDGGTFRADAGLGPDAGAETGPDAGPVVRTETEPNNGTTPDEVNALALGEHMNGTLSPESDADIFLLPTTGATLYRAHLLVAPGSMMQPHLTVLDDGRDDDGAGADYTQLSSTGVLADANLMFFAMNENPGEGQLIVVRDDRNVSGGAVGGDDFGYTVFVEPVGPDAIIPVTLPYSATHTFAHPGAAVVLQFDAAMGDDAVFTYTTAGDTDGRFFVVAAETGSWIARNDDSGAGMTNPRIDAPLFAQGTMYLVVDNINPTAENLSFSVEMTLNALP